MQYIKRDAKSPFFHNIPLTLLLLAGLTGCTAIGDQAVLLDVHKDQPIDAVNELNSMDSELQAGAYAHSQSGVSLPYQAQGNEPGWLLSLADGEVVLEWDYGQQQVHMPLPLGQPMSNGSRFIATNNQHTVAVDIVHAICRDSMSGMPYPHQVKVEVDGQNLQGCGGNPQSLLSGTEWVVEDIAGAGIIDRSRVTLNFETDGQLYGLASCNNYRGQYQVTGETLTTGPLASTRMACAPSLNNQEQRFLELLGNTQYFEIDNVGRLILRSGSGQTIEAIRAD